MDAGPILGERKVNKKVKSKVVKIKRTKLKKFYVPVSLMFDGEKEVTARDKAHALELVHDMTYYKLIGKVRYPSGINNISWSVDVAEQEDEVLSDDDLE